MNQSYQEFVESLPIISESEFDDIMESLPNTDIRFYDISWDEYDLCNPDEIARQIIAALLEQNFNYVYIENIDVQDKTMELLDVDSLEDLYEIKKMFPKWTISNYNSLVDYLKSNSDNIEKDNLLNELKENVTIQELRGLIEKYANKKGNTE